MFERFKVLFVEDSLPPPELTPEELRELMAHNWPGDVREIRNAVDRFVLEIGELTSATAGVAPVRLAQQMDKVEKALIEQAPRQCQGRLPNMMEMLGIAKKTLYDKLHRHDIDVDQFR